MDHSFGNWGGGEDEDIEKVESYKLLLEDGGDLRDPLSLDFSSSSPLGLDDINDMDLHIEDNSDKLLEPVFMPADFAKSVYIPTALKNPNPVRKPTDPTEPIYFPVDSETFFTILRQGENAGGLELFSWDPNEFQLPQAASVDSNEVSGSNITSIEGSGSSTGGAEPFHQQMRSTSNGASYFANNLKQQAALNQGKRVNIRDEVKNYFCLPDYGDITPGAARTRAKVVSVPKTAKKRGAPKPTSKACKGKKPATATTPDDDYLRRLTNPTKDELLQLATLPGDQCFDPTKNFTPDQLKLLPKVERGSGKAGATTSDIERHRRFRRRRRILKNQLVYRIAFLQQKIPDMMEQLRIAEEAELDDDAEGECDGGLNTGLESVILKP